MIRLEDLEYKNLKIFQDDEEYTFTSDAVLLANFVRIKPNEKSLELCSGSGVISILAQAKNNVNSITMIELQPNMANLSKKSVELNNLQDKINVINGDVRKITEYFERESFAYIFCNPPYKKTQSHTLSGKENIDMSKYEVNLKLSELISSVNKVLKFGGKFAIIYDTDRFVELIDELKKNKLEPKKIQFVYSKADYSSNVVLIEAVKGGKTGVKVLPSVILGSTDFNPKTMDGKDFIH